MRLCLTGIVSVRKSGPVRVRVTTGGKRFEMDALDLLRAKLAAGLPAEPAEWECANCAEFNRESQCWYCGLTKEV
jgi:hypothetical protein